MTSAVSDCPAQRPPEHVPVLQDQTDRHHHGGSRQRPAKMMVPGRLTAFTQKATITGQNQSQPNEDDAPAAPGRPK